MRTRKTVATLTVALLFVLLSGVAEAALIGVNFSEGGDQSLAPVAVAGVPGITQNSWNNMVGPTQGAPQPLVGAGSIPTGATVTWTSNNTWRQGGTPADANATLMKGYLDSSNTSTTSITLGNIPFASYDIAVYFDGGGTNRSGAYTVQTVSSSITKSPLWDQANWPIAAGGGTFVDAPNSGDTGNYSIFTGFTDPTATITATSNGTGGFRAPINAIQIVGAGPLPLAPPMPTPIGYWNFDDAGAVAADAAGNPAGANGAIQGATSVAGRFGGALDFNPAGNNQVVVQHAAAALESLGSTNEVTVAFWQYGDAAAQPRSDTIFSAQNAGNGRVLQSHLPWGNSNVYWDAGNSSDRIEKGAAPAEFEGSWQHWAFTKNQAAGTMKIYHNGALWHSGGGGLGLAGIASLVIGSGDGFEYYDGMIDDFAIWDTELSAGEIARIATSANALVFSPGTVKATLTNDAGRLSPGGDGAIGTSIIAPASGNIAPGGTATQLTTVNNAPGPRAIDGNTDGNWGAGSVTHTANSSPSWWQVELLTEQIIDDIVLWNRTDCCASRLSNFRVSVLDAGENEVWGEDFFTTTGFAPTEFLVGVPDGTEGQFVRVDKLGPGRDGWVLSLAEVEVLTPLGPSDYLQGVDAILTIEMDALTGYADKLIVSGNVALDGVLDLRYINGFPPTITTYDVLDWGGELTGEFSQILLPDMSQIDPEGRYYFDFSELYNEGWITAGRIPEPASLALLGLGALALRRRRRKA